MAKIPQPRYQIKLWTEYNNLNNVEKNLFNSFVESHLEMYKDLEIDDYFLTLIQKSALQFVHNLPEELRDVESILLSIYRRLDDNEKQFTDRVKTVDDELRDLKNKYNRLQSRFDASSTTSSFGTNK